MNPYNELVKAVERGIPHERYHASYLRDLLKVCRIFEDSRLFLDALTEDLGVMGEMDPDLYHLPYSSVVMCKGTIAIFVQDLLDAYLLPIEDEADGRLMEVVTSPHVRLGINVPRLFHVVTVQGGEATLVVYVLRDAKMKEGHKGPFVIGTTANATMWNLKTGRYLNILDDDQPEETLNEVLQTLSSWMNIALGFFARVQEHRNLTIRRTPEGVVEPRAKKKGGTVTWTLPRKHQRPTHLVVSPSEATTSLGRPKVDTKGVTTRAVHERRGHLKTFRHERYRFARGRTIWVAPTIVGPKSWHTKNAHYRVITEAPEIEDLST